MLRPPPTSTLFPYTTLFRSCRRGNSTFAARRPHQTFAPRRDRKSTRLNSSHRTISYAVFCLKKKNPMLGTLDELRSFEDMMMEIGIIRDAEVPRYDLSRLAA